MRNHYQNIGWSAIEPPSRDATAGKHGLSATEVPYETNLMIVALNGLVA